MTSHAPNQQREIASASQIFLDRFGARAPEEAEIRAQELGELGQLEAQALWLEIAHAARAKLDEHKGGRR